jgi:uncharacterized protein GlcG (DUF336 family)
VLRDSAGAVIGAVGVSGLKIDQDHALAGDMAMRLVSKPL